MTTLAMVGCTPSTAAVARRRSSVRTRTRRRSFPDDDIKTLSSVDTNATATEEEEEEDKEEHSLNNKTSRRAFFEASVVSSSALAFVLSSTTSLFTFPPSAFAIGFQKELKPKRASLSDLNLQTSIPFQFRGEEHAGVQFGDSRVGDGKEIKSGSLATIHFDVKLRGLTFSYGKLPTEYSKALKRKTVNGIGAEVRIDPELGELYVVKVSPDGPAAKAGFKANDVILEIDGTKDLANLPIQEIGALLLGPVETTVDVTVQKGGSRAGPNSPVEKYTLTREATMIVPKKQTANANVEGGGGLFNGETGPAIPPVVYVPGALEGMKVGGRRIIKTPADLGYADQGEGEIPPGSEIIVEVELLDVKDAA
ncbi:unnamed protein product [Bathycoccus prasinos]